MRTLLAVVVAAASLSACGQSCTMIGADSGVTVDLGSGSSTAMTGVQVCVHDSCTDARAMGPSSLFAPTQALDSTDPVEVVVKRAGTELLRTTATPTKVQPNGASCGPTAYQAKITLPAP